MGNPLVTKQFDKFQSALRVLRTIVSQTAVHRKKFDYCLTKFQQFLTEIYPTLPQSECKDEDRAINSGIISTLVSLRGLFTQYILETWMEPTITNPIELIILQLQTQFKDLQNHFAHYNEPLSHLLDISEETWIDLHLVDLSAILASFTQFTRLEANRDPELDTIVRERMVEIEKYLSAHKKDFDRNRLTSPVPSTYQKWIVKYEDFEIIETIGCGLSADVYKALDKRTGKFVAIKQFKEEHLSGSHLQFFQREIAVLSHLDEKNDPAFLKLVGATDTCPICIITEFMPNGALSQRLRRRKPLPPLFKTISAYDLARGMAILHSLNIIHRDIKSLNVLLDENDRIKICDFGFSRSISECGYRTVPLGTTHWMAPEILTGIGSFTFKVDVYAYGMVLSEFVNQKKPFSGMENDEIRNKVLNEDLRPTLPFDLNPELKSLITQCWDKDPKVRPTMADIVRKFESMQVFFEGTDMVEFAKHVKEINSKTPVNEKLLKKNMVKTGAISLSEIIIDLSRNGMDEEDIDGFWEAVPNLVERYNDRAKLSIFLSFFFGTKKHFDSVSILRSFPRESVPIKVIEKLANFYSSSSENQEEENTATAIVCCRNEGASLILTKATNEKDLVLALEIISYENVNSYQKSKVLEIVAKNIGSENTTVCVAAMRCALTLKAFDIIPYELLLTKESENQLVRKTALVCAMAAGLKETVFDINIIAKIVSLYRENEKEAQAALIAICTSKEIAENVLSLIKDDEINLTFVKILLQAAKHKELHATIAEILSKDSFRNSDIYNPEIEKLQNYVK